MNQIESSYEITVPDHEYELNDRELDILFGLEEQASPVGSEKPSRIDKKRTEQFIMRNGRPTRRGHTTTNAQNSEEYWLKKDKARLKNKADLEADTQLINEALASEDDSMSGWDDLLYAAQRVSTEKNLVSTIDETYNKLEKEAAHTQRWQTEQAYRQKDPRISIPKDELDAYERDGFVTMDEMDLNEWNPDLAQLFGVEEDRAEPAGSEKPSRTNQRRTKQFQRLQNGKVRKRPHRQDFQSNTDMNIYEEIQDNKEAADQKRELKAAVQDNYDQQQLDLEAEQTYHDSKADYYEIDGLGAWGQHRESEHPLLTQMPHLRRGYKTPQKVAVNDRILSKVTIDPDDLDKPEEKWERDVRKNEDKIWKFGKRSRR